MSDANLKRKWFSFRDGIITTLANIIFLVIWLLAQFGLDWLLGKVGTVDTMNYVVLQVVRVVFALGTVFPVFLNLYRDFRIMVIQVKKEIQKEESKEGTTIGDIQISENLQSNE